MVFLSLFSSELARSKSSFLTVSLTSSDTCLPGGVVERAAQADSDPGTEMKAVVEQWLLRE